MTTQASDTVDLYAPFTSDVILQVRTGSMRPMPGLAVLSGIDKTPHDGPVRVTELGLEGDEHDPTFHGGRDKAIHGYCCSHYRAWRAEFPEAADAFKPGGFGENLVTAHLNERNLCIGDVVSISRPAPAGLSSAHTNGGPNGDPADDDTSHHEGNGGGDDNSVLLQVSLPRQPCFKLNHRFRIKNFAPLTWKTSRTGWYFRVLRPGFIQAGDIIRLVQRPHPQWTIERVQEYLHRNTGDASANEELAAIPEFGAECADTFRARVVRQQARERRLQREKEAGTPKKREGWKDYRIVEKTKETPRVISLTLEAVDQSVLLANDNNNNNDEEPELRPGSHARLKLPNGLVRAYSIVSGSQDGSRLQLGVGLADPSRGGSAYLHRTAKVGDILALGAITPPPAGSRQLAKAASHHVFLAAGIGITAFLPLLEYYRDIHYSTELHYAVRSEAWDVPFRERLAALTEPPAGSSTTTTTTTTTTTMAATQNCGNGTRTPAPLTTTGASSVSVTIYDASAGKRLNVAHILSNFPWNARLYVCGPRRLMEEASREARARGIPQRDVHFEAFDADVVLDGLDGENKREPFEAIVANRGGRVVKVGRDESLLESLKRELGEDEVGSSCEVGNCGTCRVGLKSGQVEHRGTALLEEEKATAMLACVSRGVGCITIEI